MKAKKNIYYLADTNPNKDKGGIAYKIYKQMVLLKNNEKKITFIPISRKKGKINKCLSLLPFYSSKKGLEKLKNINDNSDVYIRYFFSDYNLVHTLKKFKKRNPKSKIAIEVPTYPYDGEKILPKNRPDYWKDKIWRKRLYKYVDKIVTYSDDKQIFKIPTLNISNGIDIKKTDIRKPQKSNSLNLIAVAKFGLWHGYDRMIKGLAEYYNKDGRKRNIKFYIVGYGDKKTEENYKSLIKEYNLQSKVILTGEKNGEELDYYYNLCDIGIDSLGRHRSKVYYNSSMPVMSGESDKREFLIS